MTARRRVGPAAAVVAAVAIALGLLVAPGIAGAAAAPAPVTTTAPVATDAPPLDQVPGASGAGPVASGAGAGPRVFVRVVDSPTGPVDIVRLEAWPPVVVDVSVCGAEARRGAPDCDQPGTKTLHVAADGTAQAPLRLTPPIGCPCVVRAAAHGGDPLVLLPIDIPGVPVLTPDQLPPLADAPPHAGQIEVEARYTDPASWTDQVLERLGAAPQRTLVVTVRNTGTTAVDGLTSTATFGDAGAAGTPLAVPPIGRLDPGASRTVEVAVTGRVLSFEPSVARGRFGPTSWRVAYEAPLEHGPWLLFPLLGLIAVGSLLRAWRLARRARARRSPQPSRVVESAG